MKTKRTFSLMICSFFSCILLSGFLYSDITVTLNGKSVSYRETPPKIINGRTMVPLWETAALLEIDVTYDAASKTITMKNGGNTMEHTAGTDFMAINGQWVSFDQPSVVEDGRTLLPIGMLAQVLDAEITWQGENRKVVISTNESVPLSATVEGSLQFGQKATLHIQGDTEVTQIKITDNLGSFLTQTTEFTETGSSHNFQTSFIPLSNQNPYPIRVYTGNATGFSDAYTLMHLPMKTGGSILDTQYASEIIEGELLQLTVTADSQTKEIQVLDAHHLVLDQTSQYTIKDGNRVFTLTPAPYKISSADVSMTVVSLTESGQTGDTARIDVSLAEPSKVLEIQNIQTLPSTPVEGNNVTIQIKTSIQAEKIAVTGNGLNITLDKPAESKISYKTWEYTYAAKLPGAYSYQIQAFDKNGKEVKQNATIRIHDNGENKGQIYEIRVDKKRVAEGSTFTLTVVTDNQIQEVIIRDVTGDIIGRQNKEFDDASSKIGWDFTLQANQGGDVQIDVQAKNRSGDSVYKSYTVAVDS